MRTPAGYFFPGGLQKVKYQKPPLSLDDQLDLLLSRGMTITDRDRARRYLSHISYFRLRGYWIPLELPTTDGNHSFRPGTSFDDVLDLYIFDRKFRLLMLEAIERVEVSFRAHFANELGLRYGTHFYLDSGYFQKKGQHDQLVESLGQRRVRHPRSQVYLFIIKSGSGLFYLPAPERRLLKNSSIRG